MNMLIERKKAEIVEALQEFDRIYQEMMIGTKLVTGSPANKMRKIIIITVIVM